MSVLPVSFKTKEKELYDYCKGKDFSYYVKELIKKDMLSKNFKKEIVREEEKPKQRRNANFEI